MRPHIIFIRLLWDFEIYQKLCISEKSYRNSYYNLQEYA